MRPLTHEVWEQHYVELRQPVLERWPALERAAVERVNGDYDALLELLQRSGNLSADLARLELTKLDVEELNLGTGTSGAAAAGAGRASVDRLFLGHGFSESDRGRVTERLRQLNRHLRRFPADDTALELTVKDRDATTQVVTLSLDAPRVGTIVASSKEHDLMAALADVRDTLARQIEHVVGKRSAGAR